MVCSQKFSLSVMFDVQFAVLLMVIFVIELAVGIAAGIAKEEFANAMRATLKLSMGNYTQTSTDQAAWDSMQRKVYIISNMIISNMIFVTCKITLLEALRLKSVCGPMACKHESQV